ncbi:MAG: hypothetical protein Q9168_004598 [Polycauliona sp. 1 TL-2023]
MSKIRGYFSGCSPDSIRNTGLFMSTKEMRADILARLRQITSTQRVYRFAKPGYQEPSLHRAHGLLWTPNGGKASQNLPQQSSHIPHHHTTSSGSAVIPQPPGLPPMSAMRGNNQLVQLPLVDCIVIGHFVESYYPIIANTFSHTIRSCVCASSRQPSLPLCQQSIRDPGSIIKFQRASSAFV